jgi:hypothetical protein
MTVAKCAAEEGLAKAKLTDPMLRGAGRQVTTKLLARQGDVGLSCNREQLGPEARDLLVGPDAADRAQPRPVRRPGLPGRTSPRPMRRHLARARHCRRLPGVALGLAVLVAAAGCTGPVRSDRVYASKAAATAEAAASAVETAQLAVQEAAAGKLFDRALAQTLAEAARDAGDVQATFDGIQPPDGRADALRRQLDGLLVPAVSVLADLRIAARRGDVAELPRLAASLGELGAKLEQFQEAHQ